MSFYEPPRPAPPSVTGGFGFTYADRVAARILLAVLADEMLLGNEAGVPLSVRFEQRVAGTSFDDLIVVTDRDIRWLVTIKSGDVVNSDSVDQDLLDRAWWMVENKSAVMGMDDRLVIAQPPPKADEHNALEKLCRWSREQVRGQTGVFVATDGAANLHDRKLWNRCKGSDGKSDPQAVLSRLRLLTLDLDPETSRDLGSVKHVAQGVLEGPNQWLDLWYSLLAVVSEARGNAAEIRVDNLIRKLPPTLRMKSQGEVSPEWEMLTRWGINRGPIVTTIGNSLRLDNSSFIIALSDRSTNERFLIVSGESGVGKSVVLAEWSKATGAIYFRADTLEEPPVVLQKAGCSRNLQSLLRLCRRAEIVFVIDQLDRVESDEAWANLKDWIQTLASDSRVRIVFGCGSAALVRQYVQVVAHIGEEFKDLIIERSPEEMLSSVEAEFPALATILKEYAPSPLLLSPRSLDQLIKMGVSKWPTKYAEFVDLFWNNRVQPGSPDPLVRRVAKELSEREAELGLGRLDDSVDAVALQVLRRQGVVMDDGDRMSWDHDSTGDNIRAKLLLDLDRDSQLAERLEDCVFNPMWRRAFRLLCVAVVEQEGEAGFDRLLSAVEGNNLQLLNLTLFDAIVLCTARMRMPERIAPSLKSRGNLMRKFVNRFLFTAAEPSAGTTVNPDENDLLTKAYVRVPQWKRWLPTARMVVNNFQWFADHALKEGLEVLVPYLDACGERDFLSASRPTLYLANKTIRPRQYREDANATKMLAYRGAIAALRHEPKSARSLLRRVAGRRGPLYQPRSYDFELIASPRLPNVQIWALGPQNRIDHEFQKFYLGNLWPAIVAKHDLPLAKELFYACLVDGPREYEASAIDRDDHFGFASMYNLPFFPATHMNPSINAFFDISFEDGLDVVTTLVDFAVERFLSSEGLPPDTGLPIEWGDQQRLFLGTPEVYHWLSGNTTPPYALQSLLLTLESRLLQIESLEELSEKVAIVLSRTSNLALLAVLVSVAKSRWQLLMELLAPVLFSEQVIWQDLQMSLAGSWDLMGGLSARREWWRDPGEAARYAQLPHRRNQLRQFSIGFLLYGDPEMAERGRQRWLQMAEGLELDRAQPLRLLAALYDRASLITEVADDGSHQVSVAIPEDVERVGLESQARSEDAIKEMPLHILMMVEKALANLATLQTSAEELNEALARALKSQQDQHGLFSAAIGVFIVGLKAAANGTSTSIGSQDECRSAIFQWVGSRFETLEERPHWDDRSHWTSLVAENATEIFGAALDSAEKRKALVALIQAADAPAFHRFIIAMSRLEGGLPICKTALDIGRVWAVELVRRREREMQMQMHAQFSDLRRPASLDLDYSKRVKVFLRKGTWPSDNRMGLGRTLAGSEKRGWPPSKYDRIVAGLFELLTRSPIGAFRDSIFPVLTDVLEAMTWETEERADQLKTQCWGIAGRSLAQLNPAERKQILAFWAQPARGGQEDALELVIGLIKSFASGLVSIDSASIAFEELTAAIIGPAGQQVDSDFYLRVFGIGHYGIDITWDSPSAEVWFRRHKEFYESAITRVLATRHSRELILNRLRNPGFRSLDLPVFDELALRLANRDDLGERETSAVAGLLVRCAPAVKKEPVRRDNWRRLLVALEAKGERLAWQVLAEIADRV